MNSIQIPLPFTLEPQYAEANFFVSAANEAAWGMVASWPNWTARAAIVFGDAGSGKTHLCKVWRARADARPLTPERLNASDPSELLALHKNWFVEDAESGLSERPLLHLLNSLKEADGWLLMASRLPPSQWPYRLPDLTSRLQALPTVQLLPPDEALLSNIIAKQFADRQLQISPEVVAYILAHAERSITAITALAEAADQRSLADKRAVTIPLIRDVLGPDQILPPHPEEA